MMYNACVRECMFNRVQLFVNPWTAARQACLSLGFPRQEYCSGLPFPPPGNLPNPGVEPMSPALAGRFFTTVPPRKPSEVTEGPLFLQEGYPEKELCDQHTSELFLVSSAANGSVMASTAPVTPNLCTHANVCDRATDHLAS